MDQKQGGGIGVLWMYIDKEEKEMIQGNNGNHREKRKHNKETVADNKINDAGNANMGGGKT